MSRLANIIHFYTVFYSGENINLTGGGNDKCFIIPYLKMNILNKFLLISSDDNNYQDFKECDANNKIDIKNKNYILSDYQSTISKNSLDCLSKTNLFKNKKTNNMVMWDNFNKNINTTTNIQITPNKLQILNGSLFPSTTNYQLGGTIDDEESNKLFIKTKFKDIKIQYSYQIINLLKKALLRLNNNGIILQENTIKNIQKYIKILSESENELSLFSQKILDTIKISSNFNSKNKLTLSDNTLDEYINSHKTLLVKSDNIAKKLNNTFIDLLEMIDN
jgi:hypothetical protein